ncbi:aminoglycoside adenylyltransferase domain-containing protein [Ktedonospora formicarum]|uniref:Adenylyltransferase AadA C-terminal domain-containing protein n=1 Tax=Ktedonospora formicarum TaxID=2778364 RepID=A0A8J3I3E0_9CHLR|nr:aminoglycoside adenylyltransferase domain-containing protein [Ktedonospora formicarum]GHO49412.1 hypothetical protein KSX_75750 [Ktedonospora formicarum]
MSIKPTPYADVNALLENFLTEWRTILGSKLVSCYLYGSLVTGDFDLNCSDIDLLVVTSLPLNEEELKRLREMHHDFVLTRMEWDNRIEVAYLSLTALKTYRTQASEIAIISPGEPFHTKEAGREWLVNWYVVREYGKTLFGPAPTEVIDPITRTEYFQVVREHAQAWREWVQGTTHRGAQAYAILTMCRALYTLTTGEVASKRRAAAWAALEVPEWAGLIRQAHHWREEQPSEPIDHTFPLSETQRFIFDMTERCKQTPHM